MNQNLITQLAENKIWGFDTAKEILPNILIDGSGDHDNHVMEFVDIMRRPENFYFTCKWLFNIDLHPIQLVVLQELWERKFPMLIATRGFGKSFLLALYSLLRALFHQGCKIVVIGAAFRQSKILFEYMETIYRNSPVFQDIVGYGKREGPRRDIDRCTFKIGSSEIMAIPIGDGTKIRGLRATYIISDEFSSIPQEIFEVVIGGFGSVSADPMKKVWGQARIDVLHSLGMHDQAEAESALSGFGNQTIISGTAYYHFNHFFSYWKRYKQIIESNGNKRKLEEIFQGEVPEHFDYKQYSIMRIPYNMMPKGFMDLTQIAKTKALTSKHIYYMEYGAIFAEDSDGFFKRSLIESCVCKGPGVKLQDETIRFSATLVGKPNKEYIYGVDPAFANDNFSIVIMELNDTHRRIVYCWTVNKKSLKNRLANKEDSNRISFYSFCGEKLRKLIRVFPTDHIGIDSQGGGIALMEVLHDEKQLQSGEKLIWPYRIRGDKDPFWWEKEKPTDGEPGQHILHMIEFANATFTSEANNGLAKDFEDQTVLFPEFDVVELELASIDDKISSRLYDTYEDCVMEIEELKDELSSIMHSQTRNGRDQWDTPEIKLPGNKKGRMRKDRYSALIICNQIARTYQNALKDRPFEFVGGFAGQNRFQTETAELFTGPSHLVEQMNATSYGKAIPRKR